MLVKQEPDHFPASTRETLDCFAYHLLSLQFLDSLGHDDLIISLCFSTGTFPLAPHPVKILARGHSNEPGAQGGNLAEIRQLGEELQANALEDVCRVLRGRAVLDGDRINEVLVLIDQG